MNMEKLIIMALLYLIEGQPAHEVRSISLMHALGSDKSVEIRKKLKAYLELKLDQLDKEG